MKTALDECCRPTFYSNERVAKRIRPVTILGPSDFRSRDKLRRPDAPMLRSKCREEQPKKAQRPKSANSSRCHSYQQPNCQRTNKVSLPQNGRKLTCCRVDRGRIHQQPGNGLAPENLQKPVNAPFGHPGQLICLNPGAKSPNLAICSPRVKGSAAQIAASGTRAELHSPILFWLILPVPSGNA